MQPTVLAACTGGRYTSSTIYDANYFASIMKFVYFCKMVWFASYWSIFTLCFYRFVCCLVRSLSVESEWLRFYNTCILPCWVCINPTEYILYSYPNPLYRYLYPLYRCLYPLFRYLYPCMYDFPSAPTTGIVVSNLSGFFSDMSCICVPNQSTVLCVLFSLCSHLAVSFSSSVR